MSCNFNSTTTKDLSEYGIPYSIEIPGDAIISNKYSAPKEPGNKTPFEVIISDEESFSLYINRYTVKEKRNLKKILADDFTFEKQYAQKHKSKFTVIEETTNGYLFEDKKGYDFYYYLIKDGYLTTVSLNKRNKKLSLEEVKKIFLTVQKMN